MPDLDLPEKILVSALDPKYGEHENHSAHEDCSKHELAALLSRIVEVQRARMDHLAAHHERRWAGPPTTLVILPSSVVLHDPPRRQYVETIIRFARVTGIRVRLLDDLEQVGGTGSRKVYGFSSLIAAHDGAGHADFVSVDHFSRPEMCDLVERYNASDANSGVSRQLLETAEGQESPKS